MFNILCIGKNKDSQVLSLENHYLKQTKQISIFELKALGDKNKVQEMKSLDDFLIKKKAQNVFLMTENGKQLSTKKFANLIEKQLSFEPNTYFVIAGASGFTEEMKVKYPKHLSLSLMTFPHKIARLLLIEQIYRAICIISGHPYHK